MAFVLDDTEVNQPVYEAFSNHPKMRKPRRLTLARRVQRLEKYLRLLQERLPEDTTQRNEAIEIITEIGRSASVVEKAKSRARR